MSIWISQCRYKRHDNDRKTKLSDWVKQILNRGTDEQPLNLAHNWLNRGSGENDHLNMKRALNDAAHSDSDQMSLGAENGVYDDYQQRFWL